MRSKKDNNLSIYFNTSFHNQFVILDRNILYHCGFSFKDLGKKCFYFDKVDDIEVLNLLLKNINFIDL